jgi:hypothetical protein
MSEQLERDADIMDLDIYRLIGRVEACAGRYPAEHKKWREIANRLHAARTHVRSMMSAKQRSATI